MFTLVWIALLGVNSDIILRHVVNLKVHDGEDEGDKDDVKGHCGDATGF